MKQTWLIVGLVILAAAFLEAQGRRGAGPPAGGAAIVEHIMVHGKALEGNLEGDSPDRDVTVYLPPSYRTDQNRRYPVVYLLHGFGARDDMFTGKLGNLTESADRLALNLRLAVVQRVLPSVDPLAQGPRLPDGL